MGSAWSMPYANLLTEVAQTATTRYWTNYSTPVTSDTRIIFTGNVNCPGFTINQQLLQSQYITGPFTASTASVYQEAIYQEVTHRVNSINQLIQDSFTSRGIPLDALALTNIRNRAQQVIDAYVSNPDNLNGILRGLPVQYANKTITVNGDITGSMCQNLMNLQQNAFAQAVSTNLQQQLTQDPQLQELVQGGNVGRTSGGVTKMNPSSQEKGNWWSQYWIWILLIILFIIVLIIITKPQSYQVVRQYVGW